MLQCGTPGQFAAHACGPVGPRDHLGAGQCEHELVFRKGGTTASVRVASASWINQVERWFAEPTRKRLRRGVHTSVRQLEADIRAFIDRRKSKALQMDKSADQILASVKRFCRKAQQTLCDEI
jgi:hypothetical protein